jgi:beta-carotene hydroxylase
VFNYLQHVHADEEDSWNHARNFTGRLLNFLLFNNGYHTIHHHKPGLHWSATPAAHRAITPHIHPALNERSLVWYLVRTYFLGVVIRPVRRESLRGRRQHGAASPLSPPMPGGVPLAGS